MERTPEREAKIRRVLGWRQPDLRVVVEDVLDPHNVFAIMRSADAVGVHRIEMLYTMEDPPLFISGKSSSAGTKKWVEQRRHSDVADCFRQLKDEGLRILVSRLDVSATPLHELDLAAPVALVFGNERDGASKAATAAADGTFYIPMRGMAQSLNVSVAAAVSLYEALRQREAAGLYREPRFTAPELAELEHRWMLR